MTGSGPLQWPCDGLHLATLFSYSEYVSATYGDGGIERRCDRIMGLPPERSDNPLDDSLVLDPDWRNDIETLPDAGRLPNSRSKFLFSFVGVKFLLEAFV